MRFLQPGLLLACGALLSGCASGTIGTISVPDPEGPGLEVTVISDGLAHRHELCEIEILLSDYWCQRKIPLFPDKPEPQQVTFVVDEWEEWSRNQDKRRQPVAKEQMRVRFLFNKARIDEKFMARPEFKPHVKGQAPAKQPEKPPVAQKPVQQQPAGEDRQTTNVLGGGGDRGKKLSFDPGAPTQVEFRGNEARFACRVAEKREDGSEGPQYARIVPPQGGVKVAIKVRSTDPGGTTTWWRVELLDEGGNVLPEPVQEFQFIETGNHAQAEVEWTFDGNPHIIRLSSNSPRGDEMDVKLTAVETRIPR